MLELLFIINNYLFLTYIYEFQIIITLTIVQPIIS